MTIPPGNPEYPIMKCPSCGRQYNLPELDVDNSQDPLVYSCPNCGTEIYVADEEE